MDWCKNKWLCVERVGEFLLLVGVVSALPDTEAPVLILFPDPGVTMFCLVVGGIMAVVGYNNRVEYSQPQARERSRPGGAGPTPPGPAAPPPGPEPSGSPVPKTPKLPQRDTSSKRQVKATGSGQQKRKTSSKRRRPSRVGVNPFTGEEMVFKAKPARRTESAELRERVRQPNHPDPEFDDDEYFDGWATSS